MPVDVDAARAVGAVAAADAVRAGGGLALLVGDVHDDRGRGDALSQQVDLLRGVQLVFLAWRKRKRQFVKVFVILHDIHQLSFDLHWVYCLLVLGPFQFYHISVQSKIQADGGIMKLVNPIQDHEQIPYPLLHYGFFIRQYGPRMAKVYQKIPRGQKPSNPRKVSRNIRRTYGALCLPMPEFFTEVCPCPLKITVSKLGFSASRAIKEEEEEDALLSVGIHSY